MIIRIAQLTFEIVITAKLVVQSNHAITLSSKTLLCIIDDYHTFQMHPANVCVPDHQLQSFFHAQFSHTKSVIGTKLNVTKISTAALQRFASSFALHLNSATPAKQQSHRSHYMQSTDYISQTGIKTKEN